MRQTKRLFALLAFLALLAAGCATFGVGMTEKPQTLVERYLGAVSDYQGAAHEAAIAVDGWTLAVQQGDPLTEQYLRAAEAIDRVRACARHVLQGSALLLASTPVPTDDLVRSLAILEQLTAYLQAQLLAPGGQEALLTCPQN